MIRSLFKYTLQLADTALLAGHRNSEWTGHGPVLEQDIAISNIALDQVGQARYFYQYAADQCTGYPPLIREFYSPMLVSKEGNIDEDDIAYLRDATEFYNLLLAELPRGDWAVTVLKQFFLSAYQLCVYEKLVNGPDARLSAIAGKAVRELLYHQRWSGEWVIRLGDGTEESRRRLLAALEQLWPYCGEFFLASPGENELAANGCIAAPEGLRTEWLDRIATAFRPAGLDLPPAGGWTQQGGKHGQHTEHLGYLLAEMQYLQRAYPGCEW